MLSKEDYLNYLRKKEANVYVLGEKVEDCSENPVLKPTVAILSKCLELAADPKHSDIMTGTSHLTGKKVNRFNHLTMSKEDLFKRLEHVAFLQTKTGSCAMRCAGCNALCALYSITYEMDKKLGTDYHEKFIKYAKYIQENDLVVGSGMMDVKGVRPLRPHQQPDPDFHLRIVEERSDGVIVRGCKAHQTVSAISHEMIVVPCKVLKENEKEYAVAFGIDVNTEGITHIQQHNFQDSRHVVAEQGSIDFGNIQYGSSFACTSLMIFDDVFVPNERIFMHGEYQYTYPLIRRFGSHARLTEGGCRSRMIDLLIGAGQAISEYSGLDKQSHIRDKLTQLSFLSQSIRGPAIAAAYHGFSTPSGIYLPDSLLCSTSKLQAIHANYEANKLINDIAGGFVSSMPSEKDYRNPVLHDFMEKYLGRVSGVPTEHIIRIFRFIESISMSPVVGALHYGGGTLEAQNVTIGGETNFQEYKKWALSLSGIIPEIP